MSDEALTAEKAAARIAVQTLGERCTCPAPDESPCEYCDERGQLTARIAVAIHQSNDYTLTLVAGLARSEAGKYSKKAQGADTSLERREFGVQVVACRRLATALLRIGAASRG